MMPDANALSDAISSGAWPVVAAMVILFLIYALKQPALGGLWAKIPASIQPLTSVALGIVSGVAQAITTRQPWVPALIGGLFSGLGAIGVDQVQSKLRVNQETLGKVAVLALVGALAFSQTSCSAATQAEIKNAAQTTANTLAKVENASQYVDSAWHLFCAFKPSVCSAHESEYERARAILASSLMVAHDGAQAVASGTEDAVKKAWESLDKLLVELGVITHGESLGVPASGWNPWPALEPFGR